VNAVTDAIGKDNIKAFWLVGHSQGGATSSRLVCTDFFKTRVDGFLSLSGGRIGGSPGRSSNFQNLAPRGGGPAGRGAPADGRGRGPAAAGGSAPQTSPAMACDYSHIYETGEHEIVSLPDSSAWAQKYNCDSQPKRSAVADTKAGYVYDGGRQNPGSKGWGLLPRPGNAQMFVYKGCRDGRVVADVMRLDKGHTEGLEPKVTEELVKLMLSARGGKIQKGGGAT
jgi:pimeloyl-ACP methyl ester carboxylesterase